MKMEEAVRATEAPAVARTRARRDEVRSVGSDSIDDDMANINDVEMEWSEQDQEGARASVWWPLKCQLREGRESMSSTFRPPPLAVLNANNLSPPVLTSITLLGLARFSDDGSV